jgi:hypothetical protein
MSTIPRTPRMAERASANCLRSIKPLEALIPQMPAHLLYPLDKSNLDPLR